MRRISSDKLRENLANELDKVTTERQPVVISRGPAKPAVVLMSLAEFSSWRETFHLLRSPANAARLLESMEELNEGRGQVRTLLD